MLGLRRLLLLLPLRLLRLLALLRILLLLLLPPTCLGQLVRHFGRQRHFFRLLLQVGKLAQQVHRQAAPADGLKLHDLLFKILLYLIVITTLNRTGIVEQVGHLLGVVAAFLRQALKFLHRLRHLLIIAIFGAVFFNLVGQGLKARAGLFPQAIRLGQVVRLRLFIGLFRCTVFIRFRLLRRVCFRFGLLFAAATKHRFLQRLRFVRIFRRLVIRLLLCRLLRLLLCCLL